MKTTVYAAAALCLSSPVVGFQQHVGRSRYISSHRTTVREMKSSSSIESDRRYESVSQQIPYSSSDRAKITSLSVATLEGVESLPSDAERASLLPQLNSNVDIDAITKVSSAALLITGNTVGSSMFVLPDAVGGVGMICGSAIFFGECTCYAVFSPLLV